MKNYRNKTFLILTEGCFGVLKSKTAVGLLRYGKNKIAGILDSEHAGKTTRTFEKEYNTRLSSKLNPEVPFFASLEEGMQAGANTLVVGVAPRGGGLPDSWVMIIEKALQNGMHIISGLHDFLSENKAFASIAESSGSSIWDLRKHDLDFVVAQRRTCDMKKPIILTVGADCNVGKMTLCTEYLQYLQDKFERGTLTLRPKFVPTGQTGMLIEGRGVGLDRLPGDFIAGAVEREILSVQNQGDFFFVEGQGSLWHCGYSAVTYGLIHGTAPSAMIYVDQPSRKFIRDESGIQTPEPAEAIRFYEQVASIVRPGAKVIAVALNCFDLSEDESHKAIEDYKNKTGLPVTDPVKFGCEPLFQATLDHVQSFYKELSYAR